MLKWKTDFLETSEANEIVPSVISHPFWLFSQCSHSFALSHVPHYKNIIKNTDQKVSGPGMSMATWVSLEVSGLFFFSVPRDTFFLIYIFKKKVRCYPCNCRDYHSAIHTSFFHWKNNQTKLMWSLNENTAYVELPRTYLFLLSTTSAKADENWLVHLNRSHAVFQEFEQHKLALEAFIWIWLRQLLCITHCVWTAWTSCSANSWLFAGLCPNVTPYSFTHW